MGYTLVQFCHHLDIPPINYAKGPLKTGRCSRQIRVTRNILEVNTASTLADIRQLQLNSSVVWQVKNATLSMSWFPTNFFFFLLNPVKFSLEKLLTVRTWCSSFSGKDDHLHRHPWLCEFGGGWWGLSLLEGSRALGAGQRCWQSWGSGDAACPGFAHFPLIFCCLNAVLLVGSGSLWDSTMPSWLVLSEGFLWSRVNVNVLHGDFQGVPEAFLLAEMGACSSSPKRIRFGRRSSDVLVMWPQPSEVVMLAALCGHWTCRSALGSQCQEPIPATWLSAACGDSRGRNNSVS